ncbi:unnamed protein product [Meganyctiphanes norvegica]|uniref:Uncharacterized protein n=1 Tax=Meganyctiphanes norvegica TaxID=48144 RepID=A0AAV2PQ76_MEGNR
MYVHGSSAFRYLRIRAKITGCRESALYSEKYLIPGDLGLASGNFQYLLELSSGIERGQHVFHVTRAEENKHGVHTHVNKAFNESIAMGTGLGCGQVHSYLPEAFGATLCTPYRPHHARDANGNHTFRVYAPNTKDVTANYPVPPQETTDLNWKPFIPWLIIHYFNLRSWESRAQGMALVCTLGMYLVYLLFKSRRVTRHYTTQEQERADGRIV